jgi:hypothetical protein
VVGGGTALEVGAFNGGGALGKGYLDGPTAGVLNLPLPPGSRLAMRVLPGNEAPDVYVGIYSQVNGGNGPLFAFPTSQLAPPILAP